MVRPIASSASAIRMRGSSRAWSIDSSNPEPRIAIPGCISSFTPHRPSAFCGAPHPPEPLVERAAALGYPALALVDADGVYGAPRFHKAAKQAGIKAIIGAELTVKPQTPNPKSQIPTWRLPVLVESADGYRNL